MRKRSGEVLVQDPIDNSTIQLDPAFTTINNESKAILDQELDTLPKSYRLALILCDCEGMSRKEAAAKLNIPEGTLSSRLHKGRELLAARLTHRGVAVLATAISGLFTQAGAAEVSDKLLLKTTEAAFGSASPTVAAASKAVLIAISTGKIKLVLLVGFLLLATAGITGGGMLSTTTNRSDAISPQQNVVASLSETPTKSVPVVQNPIVVPGTQTLKFERYQVKILAVSGGGRFTLEMDYPRAGFIHTSDLLGITVPSVRDSDASRSILAQKLEQKFWPDLEQLLKGNTVEVEIPVAVMDDLRANKTPNPQMGVVVWLSSTKSCLNLDLVKSGVAKAARVPGFGLNNAIKDAERTAREQKLRIWSEVK